MKIGLVLPGGGGKGAYQIGAIEALEELGIKKHIKYISGTSIGSLNSLLFMQDDLELAKEVWNNISIEKILPIDNFDLMKRSFLISVGTKKLNFIKKYIPSSLQQGNLSRDGLLEIAERYLDVDKISNSNIISYATCTDIDTLKAKYFKYNDTDAETIKRIFLATSAIPTIYEPEEIEGKFYLDGGIINNVPIQPLYGEGCDIIIVVHLSREFCVDKSLYPNSKIIEIFPSYMEEGVFKGTLNFSQETLKKRIIRGYDDTMTLLEPIFELALYCNFRIQPNSKVYDFIKYIR